MKAYQIEFKRVTYFNTTIEAETLEEAKNQAWDELSEERTWDGSKDADWSIESIEVEMETK